METLEIGIKVSSTVLINFLQNPFNLRLWTVHRDLYEIQETCNECIITNKIPDFAEIKTLVTFINTESTTILFSWFQNSKVIKSFEFKATSITESEVKIELKLPYISDTHKRDTLIKLISIEFNLLKQYLENGKASISKPDAIFLQSYHKNLSY